MVWCNHEQTRNFIRSSTINRACADCSEIVIGETIHRPETSRNHLGAGICKILRKIHPRIMHSLATLYLSELNTWISKVGYHDIVNVSQSFICGPVHCPLKPCFQNSNTKARNVPATRSVQDSADPIAGCKIVFVPSGCHPPFHDCLGFSSKPSSI